MKRDFTTKTLAGWRAETGSGALPVGQVTTDARDEFDLYID
jgi:hypothetical protein